MMIPVKSDKNEKISQRYADFILFIGSIPAALFFVFNKILMENRMVKHLILYFKQYNVIGKWFTDEVVTKTQSGGLNSNS